GGLGDDGWIALLGRAFDAAALEAERGVAAGAGGNRERDGAVEGGDFHLRAEQRLVEADRDVDGDVDPLAAKIRVGEDLGDDEEVAGLATGDLLAAALDADAAAFLDAGGDLDVDRFELAVAVDLEGQGHAAGGLGEGEGDGVFDVLAALGLGANAAAGL